MLLYSQLLKKKNYIFCIAWLFFVFPIAFGWWLVSRLVGAVVLRKTKKTSFLEFLTNLWMAYFYVKHFATQGLSILHSYNSSVIRQKGQSQNGCFKKTKHVNSSEKRIFLTPLIRTYAYQGVRNVRSLENVMCFVFLKHPFWDSPFCLITDELS